MLGRGGREQRRRNETDSEPQKLQMLHTELRGAAPQKAVGRLSKCEVKPRRADS